MRERQRRQKHRERKRERERRRRPLSNANSFPSQASATELGAEGDAGGRRAGAALRLGGGGDARSQRLPGQEPPEERRETGPSS